MINCSLATLPSNLRSASKNFIFFTHISPAQRECSVCCQPAADRRLMIKSEGSSRVLDMFRHVISLFSLSSLLDRAVQCKATPLTLSV